MGRPEKGNGRFCWLCLSIAARISCGCTALKNIFKRISSYRVRLLQVSLFKWLGKGEKLL
jgi:hypothetical protein